MKSFINSKKNPLRILCFFITLFITFLFCDQCFQQNTSLKETQNCIFGSPELKAKVRFSHHILSGVRLSVYLPISKKVCTEHPSVRGFKFINMKRHAIFQKEIIKHYKNSVCIFKIYSDQNQICQKSCNLRGCMHPLIV